MKPDKWAKEREKFDKWAKAQKDSPYRTSDYDCWEQGAWEAWKYLMGPYREGAKDHA